MTQVTGTLGGFKLRLGQYHFRLWSKGFEFGNKFGGRTYFFPWVKFDRKDVKNGT